MLEELKRIRESLKFYGNPGDYLAPYTGGMGVLYFDCGKTAQEAITTLDAIIGRFESEELVEEVTEAIIRNKRDGSLGQIDPNWYPGNFEYGNIKAEAETAINAIKGISDGGNENQ